MYGVRWVVVVVAAIVLGAFGACTPLRGLDPIDDVDAARRDGGARADSGEDAPALDTGNDAPCSSIELCNGRDDDCDPATADGSADPSVGIACDGPDADLCAEGTSRCEAGAVACSDVTSATAEVCDGSTDEDCDGHVDEMGAVGEQMFYADRDHDGYGDSSMPSSACTVPATHTIVGGDCDDAAAAIHPGAAERCNATDDDCDDRVDDDNPCAGCTTQTSAGRTYQICQRDVLSWDDARLACMGFGYDLARIETPAEQAFLQPFVPTGPITAGLWIGLRSDAAGQFMWTDGSIPTYTDWASGEPNLTSSCVRLRGIVGGLWADTQCTTNVSYLCEAP